MTGFLARLVDQPTTLGHEEGGQEVVREALRELGLEPVDVPMDADALRANPVHSPFDWDVRRQGATSSRRGTRGPPTTGAR